MLKIFAFKMEFDILEKVEADRIWWSLRTSNPLSRLFLSREVGSIPTPSAKNIFCRDRSKDLSLSRFHLFILIMSQKEKLNLHPPVPVGSPDPTGTPLLGQPARPGGTQKALD